MLAATESMVVCFVVSTWGLLHDIDIATIIVGKNKVLFDNNENVCLIFWFWFD
jgi:hypothetical protein